MPILERRGLSRSAGAARVASLALGVALASTALVVRADQLDAEVSDDERGYTPVQELSYEVILDPGDASSHAATMRLRVALHNASGTPRDAVHTLAIPSGAELVGLSTAKDGVWTPGAVTTASDDAGQRDVGTVWARTVDQTHARDQPAAEIIAFGIAGESTLQVELELRVLPTLRNGRWELDLPSHGPASPQLASDRRVLVRGLAKGKQFWVDDRGNGTEPAVSTDAFDTVTVGWPARGGAPGNLLVRYDIVPGPAGFDDGRFRVVLRAGTTPAPTPDHVVFVIDRSRSTAPLMHREASRVISAMLDALPADATFDAIGFARTSAPLFDPTVMRHPVRDTAARGKLVGVLDANIREQGTDMPGALELAATRATQTRAQRPMIVVVTDGMLPASLDTSAVRTAYDAAVGKDPGARRPELLFVVDDPLLAQGGLPATHPVATMAATLGARISLETLAQVPDDDVLRLLAAPRVLGSLALDLPSNMVLDDPLPTGLVSGNAMVLRGSYSGIAAKRLTVRGRAAGRPVVRKVKASVAPAHAEAFVVTKAELLADAQAEGLVRPTWLRPRQRRMAREGVAQAGRGREVKGLLDEKIFRNYLTTRVMPRARVCYNRALARASDQGGRVVLEIEVGKGEVMRATVRDSTLVHGDDALVACLTEAAWALDVPAAKMDEKVYVVRYPVRLVAPTEPGARGHVAAIDKDLLEILLAQPVVPTVHAKTR